VCVRASVCVCVFVCVCRHVDWKVGELFNDAESKAEVLTVSRKCGE
jgi:hypothetical protein